MEFSTNLLAWQILLLTLVSFLVGVLGGFVGLALGTMRLPALLLIGVPPSTAAGTNILVSALSALVGGLRHIRGRRVNWRIVALMGGPAVAGSFAGGFSSSWAVPEGALIIVAGTFVIWQSVEFLMRLRQAVAAQQFTSGTQTPLSPGREALEAVAGLVVGLVGGAVGLILGSVRLPILIRLRVDPRVAAGTNLVIGFFMGVFGFVGHGLKGEVDPVILTAMGLSGMAGAYIGAQLTGRASVRILLVTMSGVLLVVGVLLVRDGVSSLLA
jgi:hypothetical protein